jgi:glutathione S-transferase
MWTRRIDLYVCEPMANGFRYGEGLPMFKSRITTLPEASEGLKRLAQEKITWLDGLLGDKQYFCGNRLSLADVLLYCFLAFGTQVGQPLNPANKNIKAWFDRMAARPSAKA